MCVELNHTIVPASDPLVSARFLPGVKEWSSTWPAAR
jgi:hypothetical protein